MARKKAEQAPGEKKNLIVIRGYESWREWLEGYAEHKGVPAVALIDMLLRESARKDGYAAPPKRY